MKKVLPQIKRIQEHKVIELDKETTQYISYSQALQYRTCPHQWYLGYVKGLRTYSPTLHTSFGTAFHETVQDWLTVLYTESASKADNMDLPSYLLTKMKEVYVSEKEKSGGEHFATSEELNEFYQDGVEILKYLKRKRTMYFSTKYIHLVGVEIPLIQELRPSLYFKGFIDLVLYDSDLDKYIIIDIKTSTSGWSSYAKKDDKKLAQLLLYKEYFSKQFQVDVDKIDVKYVIVKRKVPDDPDYPSMGRRIQEFEPPSGKIKRGQAMTEITKFISDGFDETGKHIDKDYEKVPSKSNCRFCEFRDTEHCSVGII